MPNMNQLDRFDGRSVESVLQQLGQRLKKEKKRRRIGQRFMTDEDLARRAGVSRSTIVRLWEGEAVATDNLIRVLRALDRLDLLQPLILAEQPTPLERMASPRRPRGRPRKTKPRDDMPMFSEANTPMASQEAFRNKYAMNKVEEGK